MNDNKINTRDKDHKQAIAKDIEHPITENVENKQNDIKTDEEPITSHST